MRAHVISTATVFSLLVVGTAMSQTSPQAAPDPHHPPGQPTASTSPSAMSGGPSGGMMGGADMGRMMSMMHGNGMSGMGARHVEGRIAFLKTELKITSSQNDQWGKYADALRANAGDGRSAMPPMMSGAMGQSSAPDVLDRQEQSLVKRLAALRGLKGALAPLYQTLTTEQKKLADELLVGPMGMM